MTNENELVWLRLVDAGTDNECWFVCNRCDPGAIPFIPESEITRPAEVGGDGWSPIESAETNISVNDPTRCLVYGPEIGVQFGAVWKRADGTAGGRAEGFQGDWKITHFRPEPGAPLE